MMYTTQSKVVAGRKMILTFCALVAALLAAMLLAATARQAEAAFP